jgi:hypothetical protein
MQMMIMEAMRLSLIDHEEQQRRQREEETRNQQSSRSGGDTGSTSEGRTLSSQRSQSSFMGSSTPTPNTPPASTQGLGGRLGHQSSDSLIADLPNTLWQRRRSSPPPFSTIGVSMDSASASAILTTGDNDRENGDGSRTVESDGPLAEQRPSVLVVISSDNADSPTSANGGDPNYGVLQSSPESSSHVPLLE